MINTILTFSFVIAVAITTCFEFIFHDAPELFEGGDTLATILVNLSLSYIAGYIIYLVTVVAPARIERNNAKEHIAYLIEKIMFRLLSIVYHAINNKIIQPDLISRSDVSQDELKELSADVNLLTLCHHYTVRDDGENMCVGEALVKRIQELESYSSKLFDHYSKIVQPEVLSIISSSLYCEMNEMVLDSYRMRNAVIKLEGEEITYIPVSMDRFSSELDLFLVNYHALKNVLIEKYPNTKAARKYMELMPK
ncbi:hypothetical protein NI378_06350 [Vibrio parahaemolyticus]|nr:hypothetical protein NI378_06350 [Vibrio parahaemolyticus]